MLENIIDSQQYKSVFENIKNKVLESQYKAMQRVNVEMIYLYWNIGNVIIQNSIWGNKFIDNLALDLKMEFPRY